MAKFHGVVGYFTTEETSPGVHVDGITEVPCQGDILRNTQRFESSEQLNDDVTIDNRFSIVADGFMTTNMANIRYVEYLNIKWKVVTIDIQPPRLILKVRGVYNG